MKIAKLKEPFETHKKDKEFDVVPMDMFWLSDAEKGGLCVVLGMMSYLRITHPDGTKTQYYDLFNYTLN